MYKRKLKQIIACFTLLTLIASCQTHYTIKKRHYSSGYYISGGSTKTLASDKVIEEKSAVKEKENLMTLSTVKDSATAVQVTATKNETLVATAKISSTPETSSVHAKAIPNQHPESEPLVQTKESKNSKFHIPLLNKLSPKSNINSRRDSSDGLSLLWIVIIILLILWAIGYLGGSMGSLIHLLLVIALILLILWLLRII